jgi:peptidoglycan/LPS O-acetylase OafA/YrhL
MFMKQTFERITALDGLRGIAAVIVVFYHVMLGFYPSVFSRNVSQLHTQNRIEWLIHDTPLAVVVNGNFAVVLFLVLSGFVAGLQFRKRPGALSVFMSFIKRFFRFWLPILATNILAVFALLFGLGWNQQAGALTGSANWLEIMWRMDPSFVDAFTQSVGSMFRMYSRDIVYNSSVWTMPFFLAGPLLVGALMVVISRYRWRWLAMILVIAVLFRSYYWYFVLGLMLFEYKEIFVSFVKKPLIAWILVVMALFFGGYTYSASLVDSSWFRFLPSFHPLNTTAIYYGLASALLIIALLGNPVLSRWFSSKPLQALGKYSFALYLFHIFVINTSLSYLFFQVLKTADYSIAVLAGVVVSTPLLMVGTVGLYQLVEVPAARLGFKITSWRWKHSS